MNPVITDESIFRDRLKELKGFSSIPYHFNINHPLINLLWHKYIEQSEITAKYLPSDKHRKHFESQIIKKIKAGLIIVVIKHDISNIPDELKEVVVYE